MNSKPVALPAADVAGCGGLVATRGRPEPSGVRLSRGVHRQVSGKLDVACRAVAVEDEPVVPSRWP